MSTSNKQTESFVDQVENFFGLKKQPTESTSSHERVHDNIHASADDDAAHRAAMVSDKIPTPVPTQILDQVKQQHGKVPHAHHVDINKVEQQHQPQGLGHVMKEPNMLDKMSTAIKNVTSSSQSSSSMTTSISAKDNIPHSSLPNDTLKEIKSAKGSVPHAHHVDINKVEAQHQPTGLGHVQKDPNMLDKMGAAMRNMTGSMASAPSSSSTSTSIHTRDNIPHSALSDRTLTEIQKAKGSVPHAHHVDINKVEQQHQPPGLGHVQEISTMDKMKQTLHNMAEKITPETSSSTSTTGKYANVTLTSPHAHSSLPDYVLQDIPKAHVPAPTGHHVDVNRIEEQHNRRLSLGRVIGDVSTLDERAAEHQPLMTERERQPSLVEKVQDVATRVSDKLMGTSAPVQQHEKIPQSSLGPAVMKDIRQQHGHVPNAHHVPVIEHPSVPLGHVVDDKTKTTKRD